SPDIPFEQAFRGDVVARARGTKPRRVARGARASTDCLRLGRPLPATCEGSRRDGRRSEAALRARPIPESQARFTLVRDRRAMAGGARATSDLPRSVVAELRRTTLLRALRFHEGG